MSNCMAVRTQDGRLVYITDDMTDDEVRAALEPRQEPREQPPLDRR